MVKTTVVSSLIVETRTPSSSLGSCTSPERFDAIAVGNTAEYARYLVRPEPSLVIIEN